MIDLDNSTSCHIDLPSLENIKNSLTQKGIELLIVHNDEIQELNKEHRNIDKATDVLSFPLDFDMSHPYYHFFYLHTYYFFSWIDCEIYVICQPLELIR